MFSTLTKKAIRTLVIGLFFMIGALLTAHVSYSKGRTPPAPPVENGYKVQQLVSFKSAHGRYLVAEKNGGKAVNANRHTIGSWERFNLKSNGRLKDGSKVIIQTGNGHYFSAQPSGTLDANRIVANSWETFTLINHSSPGGYLKHGHVVSLKSAHNKYIVAESKGGANANRGGIGAWEKFTVLFHTPIHDTEPSYDLAQGCFSIQDSIDDSFLVLKNNNDYRFEKVGEGAAAKFFLKPTKLGTFMLYNQNGTCLTAESSAVRNGGIGSKAEWRISSFTRLGSDEQTLVSAASGMRMGAFNGLPLLASDVGTTNPYVVKLNFIAAAQEECRAFPEAPLCADVSPDFYETRDPAEPVVGYADIHSHLAFPKAIGAVAISGDIFHRFGIQKALRSCSDLHGANGEMDLLGSQHNGPSGHSTSGYPNFDYWPSRHSGTHIQAYYKWVQRAYLSGMRLMVTFATGHKTMCQIMGIIHSGKKQGDCSSDSVIRMQTQYIRDMQDYIDAQEGGQGKGWFRIVTSPDEARDAISQNKLAVLLGSEYNTLFDCNEGAAQCTNDYIDAKLDELYDLGIRVVFPIHRLDNAFGGTIPQGGSAGAWINLTNKINTGRIDKLTDLIRPSKLLFKPIGGHFWDLEESPPGVSGTGNIKPMDVFIDEDFSFLKNQVTGIPVVGGLLGKLFDGIFINKLSPLPDYSQFNRGGINAINRRGLQEKGRHLINRLMDKGMIVELDHMSYPTLLQALDTFEFRQYSGVVSSHSFIEKNAYIRGRIYNLGGIVAPMSEQPQRMGSIMEEYSKEMEEYPYHMGIAIGSDVQGLATLPASDHNFEVAYPFHSYDGTVKFTQPKTGSRVFDYNTEGVANYALYAEWIENLRYVDERSEADIMDLFMNSAEAYLQMWERADNSAIER